MGGCVVTFADDSTFKVFLGGSLEEAPGVDAYDFTTDEAGRLERILFCVVRCRVAGFGSGFAVLFNVVLGFEGPATGVETGI